MQPNAIIISILFVILHTSSIDCLKSGFNREKPIHRHKFSHELCPDGSISAKSGCKNIFSSVIICPDDYIVVDGKCQRIHQRKYEACDDDNNEVTGTKCIDSISKNSSCRNGRTRDGGVCRDVEHPHDACPEGSEMIRGTCYEVLTTKPNCPEGYEVIENKCRREVREIVECPEGQKLVNGNCEEIATTTTTTTEPEPCPEGTKRINNICTGRAKSCSARFKRVFGQCRYVDPNSYLCTPGFEWIHGRCRFGHM